MDTGFSGIMFSSWVLGGGTVSFCFYFCFCFDAEGERVVHSQYLRFSSPKAPCVLCEAMIGESSETEDAG